MLHFLSVKKNLKLMIGGVVILIGTKKCFFSSILILVSIAIVLSGCQSRREIIELTNSRGFALTDNAGTILPIVAFEIVDQDELLHAPYQPIDGATHLELGELFRDSNVPIQQFSLSHVNLMLHQNYEKPVILQITIGRPDDSTLWDHVWEEGQEAVFDISGHFGESRWNEPLGILITILRLDENDIVVEYERYFFIIQNMEEDIN